MALGAVLLLLLVSIIVVLFVAWPFIKHWRVEAESGHEISALLAERDHVLDSIQELDFDNSLGKVPPEEYPAQRKALIQKGAEVLHQLDCLAQPAAPMKKSDGHNGVAAAAILEVSAAPLLAVTASQPIILPTDDELEELIAKRRVARKEKTAGFCPNCGKPLMQSDQFCPSCGHKVK